MVYTGLGEREQALRYLERAYEERSTVLAYLLIDLRLALRGLLHRLVQTRDRSPFVADDVRLEVVEVELRGGADLLDRSLGVLDIR